MTTTLKVNEGDACVMERVEFESVGEMYGGEHDERLSCECVLDYIDTLGEWASDEDGVTVVAYQREEITVGMIDIISRDFVELLDCGEACGLEELMDPDGRTLLSEEGVEEVRAGMVALLTRVLHGPETFVWGCRPVATRDYSQEEIEAMRKGGV